jgi:hypothetical protein
LQPVGGPPNLFADNTRPDGMNGANREVNSTNGVDNSLVTASEQNTYNQSVIGLQNTIDRFMLTRATRNTFRDSENPSSYVRVLTREMRDQKHDINLSIDRVVAASSRVTLRHFMASSDHGEDSNVQRARRILDASSQGAMDTA